MRNQSGNLAGLKLSQLELDVAFKFGRAVGIPSN